MDVFTFNLFIHRTQKLRLTKYSICSDGFLLTAGVDGYSTLKEDEELSMKDRDTQNVLMKNKVLIE
jgi:hypothetical protein